MTAVAKITSKGQTTVPRKVRDALKVRPGDSLVWEVVDGAAHVRRAEPIDIEYARSLEGTLTEWNGQNDEDAYRDL